MPILPSIVLSSRTGIRNLLLISTFIVFRIVKKMSECFPEWKGSEKPYCLSDIKMIKIKLLSWYLFSGWIPLTKTLLGRMSYLEGNKCGDWRSFSVEIYKECKWVLDARIWIIFCFMLCSTARVILRRVVNGWRNQCILVGQDSALLTTGHWQVTTNFLTWSTRAEIRTGDIRS